MYQPIPVPNDQGWSFSYRSSTTSSTTTTTTSDRHTQTTLPTIPAAPMQNAGARGRGFRPPRPRPQTTNSYTTPGPSSTALGHSMGVDGQTLPLATPQLPTSTSVSDDVHDLVPTTLSNIKACSNQRGTKAMRRARDEDEYTQATQTVTQTSSQTGFETQAVPMRSFTTAGYPSVYSEQEENRPRPPTIITITVPPDQANTVPTSTFATAVYPPVVAEPAEDRPRPPTMITITVPPDQAETVATSSFTTARYPPVLPEPEANRPRPPTIITITVPPDQKEAVPTTFSTTTSYSSTFTTKPVSTLEPTMTAATTRSPSSVGELPDMPFWAVSFLAGLLSFGFVIAVAMFLVNFPPKYQWLWLKKALRIKRRRYGYTAVRGGEGDESDDRRSRHSQHERIRSSPANGTIGLSTAAASAGSAKRRNKSRGLSIDTKAQYHGLGIAVIGDEQEEQSQLAPPSAGERQRRKSYDEERLRYRQAPPPSPSRFAWEAVTAPLPSASTFTARELDGGRNYKHVELETGNYSARSEDSEEFFDPKSPAYQANGVHVGPKSGVFERIGDGVEYMARKMAKVVSDQVKTDPEEGLLLPVRSCEREQVGSPRVAVR